MTRLYELTDAYAHIQHLAEEEDSQEPSWDLALSDIMDSIEHKCENIAKLVRCLESDANALSEEAARLSKIAKSRENRVRDLKEYLKANLERAGIDKVKGILFTVALQVSPPSCEIIDESAVPESFKVLIPETWRVDRRAIIEYWKEAGTQVAGTVVVQDRHVRIR